MLPLDQAASALKSKARTLGFDLAAIAPAGPTSRSAYWRQWLADGRAGDMAFMADRIAERLDPQAYMPGALSAICVALNYHVTLTHTPADPASGGGDEGIPASGRIARYALADDYHDWMKHRLYDLADYLRDLLPGHRTRAGVDSAPIPERELAERAGIGWVGKNTCILNAHLGSWLFLGTILTTADLPPDGPTSDRCGSCTRCLDACPTGALTPTRPYELDPRKCISYLTIEHRGDFPPDLARQMGNWLYGCDICQDVCPWNRRAPTATDPHLQPRHPSGQIDATPIPTWTEADWHPFSRRTAIRRLGLPLLKRNAANVIRNAALITE